MNSNDTPLESSTPLRLDKIDETREELWNLWKSAVDDYDEDKLIPLEIYDISGRRVKEPLSSGIYIRNGKTMFVR